MNGCRSRTRSAVDEGRHEGAAEPDVDDETALDDLDHGPATVPPRS